MGVVMPDYLQRVWDLVAEGHSNKEIAYRLELSEQSVKNYAHTLMGLTQTANRTALAIAHPRYAKCR